MGLERPLAAAVAGVAATAVAARLPAALDYAFWQDEVASARAISEPDPISLLRYVVRGESTPPAWYALAWLGRVAGLSVEVLRVISVAAGATLAAAVVVYARRLVPFAAACLAGLFVALGWQLVLHGWELRAYALHALASFLFVVALERAAAIPSRGRLVTLGAAVLLGSLTHYFFLLTLLAGVVWLWQVRPRPRAGRSLTLAIALGLVPLALWSPAIYRQHTNDRFAWIGGFELGDVERLYVDLFVRQLPTGLWGHVAALGVTGLVAAGCAVLWRRSPAGQLCALAAGFPLLGAAAAWLLGANVFVARNLIGIAAFAAVAIAAALAALPTRAARTAGLAVAASLVLVTYVQGREPRPTPFDKVAKSLVEHGWTASDPLVVLGTRFAYLHPLGWYLPGRPTLATVQLARVSCPTVFVAGGRRRVERLAGTGGGVTIGTVSVNELSWTPRARRLVRRLRGHVLVVEESPPPCVRGS